MIGSSPNIASLQTAKPAEKEALLWAVDQRDPRTIAAELLNDARNLRFADGLPATRKGVTKPAWANRVSPVNQTIASLGHALRQRRIRRSRRYRMAVHRRRRIGLAHAPRQRRRASAAAARRGDPQPVPICLRLQQKFSVSRPIAGATGAQ